jgi:hypothetical protein
MDQAYWLERERDAIENGRTATLADVRLIHFDLARRYSIEAAHAKASKRRPRLKSNLGEQLATAFHSIRTPAA